jgi:hypothetical protein
MGDPRPNYVAPDDDEVPPVADPVEALRYRPGAVSQNPASDDEGNCDVAVVPKTPDLAASEPETLTVAGVERGAEVRADLFPKTGENREPSGTLRPISPIDIDDLTLGRILTGQPICEDVDPRALLVDEAYQRNLSPKSLALIEKIACEWDWRRFKPPVCAFADGGLQIIDGQHTAIGAASRPDIRTIPVMIVEAPNLKDRASAFIGHNRDRLAVSPIQLHHAAVAAGDPMAATIERVCGEAGAVLIRSAYGGYRWKVGDTVAITAVRGLIERQGERFARMILALLVEAQRAPIRADELKAAELLFTHVDYVEHLEPLAEAGGADLAKAIQSLGDTAEKEAKTFAAAHAEPLWKALAVIWFRKTRKRRKAA